MKPAEKTKINYSRFTKIMSKLLIFVEGLDSEEIEEFYQYAYIIYKTSCKNYCLETVQDWAENFYQEFSIPDTNMMLASRHNKKS